MGLAIKDPGLSSVWRSFTMSVKARCSWAISSEFEARGLVFVKSIIVTLHLAHHASSEELERLSENGARRNLIRPQDAVSGKELPWYTALWIKL